LRDVLACDRCDYENVQRNFHIHVCHGRNSTLSKLIFLIFVIICWYLLISLVRNLGILILKYIK